MILSNHTRLCMSEVGHVLTGPRNIGVIRNGKQNLPGLLGKNRILFDFGIQEFLLPGSDGRQRVVGMA